MASSATVNSHQSYHTPQQQQQQQQGQPLTPPSGELRATPVWQNPNPPLPRGRAPRDPLAVTTKLQCTTLQDMETQLRNYLENPPAAAEHCTCELTLWAGASFLVKLGYVPPNLRINNPQQPHDMGMLQAVADYNAQRLQQPIADGQETTLSVLDALQQLGDPKETMKRQRAISKVCVASVQKTDGYRYSFHNSWKSGEDNAYRFSYYCNDSLLNKDRVANGKSGSQGKRATKPVFDCKGVLSIKFSATRQCIDVVYKHIPCHETYEIRAPPPRKNSKRRADWEAKNPDRVKASRSEDPEVDPVLQTAKRKKKKVDTTEPVKSAEAELREASMFSLLELMRPDEPKKPEQQQQQQQPTPAISSQPADTASSAGPADQPGQAPSTAGSQKKSSRRQPKNSAQCAVCISRRTKCDGSKPRCKTCTEKGWYCFYQTETQLAAQAQAQAAASNQPPRFPPPQVPNSMPMPQITHGLPLPISNFDPALQQQQADIQQQREIAAVTLAKQNQELQKDLATFRKDQTQAQQEAMELKNQLAEMKAQLDALKAAEKSRVSQPASLPQPTPQSVHQSPMSQQSSVSMAQQSSHNLNIGHERSRSSHQHHQLPTSSHVQHQNYAPQYQTNAQHMYHQATSNQNTHSRSLAQPIQPIYQTVQQNDQRAQQQPTNAWNQGLYGAYQQSQNSHGMLPSTHMMGRYG